MLFHEGVRKFNLHLKHWFSCLGDALDYLAMLIHASVGLLFKMAQMLQLVQLPIL